MEKPTKPRLNFDVVHGDQRNDIPISKEMAEILAMQKSVKEAQKRFEQMEKQLSDLAKYSEKHGQK